MRWPIAAAWLGGISMFALSAHVGAATFTFTQCGWEGGMFGDPSVPVPGEVAVSFTGIDADGDRIIETGEVTAVRVSWVGGGGVPAFHLSKLNVVSASYNLDGASPSSPSQILAYDLPALYTVLYEFFDQGSLTGPSSQMSFSSDPTTFQDFRLLTSSPLFRVGSPPSAVSTAAALPLFGFALMAFVASRRRS